jgi:hypothetical protein
MSLRPEIFARIVGSDLILAGRVGLILRLNQMVTRIPTSARVLD